MSDRVSRVESPSRGEVEISWKVPVTAAIAGALLVSVFVIYAIVVGPADESDTGAVQSTELPHGFTPLPGGSGIKVEFVTQGEEEIHVGIASAVPGTAEPRLAPPVEVAYWELETDAGSVLMDRQFGADTTANTTVVFNGEMISGDQHVVAHPVMASTQQSTTLEVTADGPGETFEFTFDVAEEVTVAGEVTVGDGWGYVDWSADANETAMVDVVVTFAGLEDPSSDALEVVRLVPGHLLDRTDGSGVVRAAPLFSYGGQYQLYRTGGSADAQPTRAPIVIEITSTVVTTLGEPVVVTFPNDA